MSKKFRGHSDEAVMLSFLDGELSERDANALRSHLGSCWQCRRSLGELQNTIDAFLRFRETIQFAADPPPPKPWAPFDQICPSSNTVAAEWLRLWKLAAVALAFLAVVLGSVVIFHTPEPAMKTVSSAVPPHARTESTPELPKAKVTHPEKASSVSVETPSDRFHR